MCIVASKFAALMCGSYDLDITLTLQTLCFTMIATGNLSKFNSFWKNGAAVRYLMNSVIDTWSTAHGDTLEILERRAKLGRSQAVFFTIFLYPAAVILILCRTASYVMVVTAPPEANVTDPFPLLTDYFVPQEKYYTLKVLHQNFSIFLIGTIPSGTETLYIMWLQHSISLFELASYYFEKGIGDRPSTTSTKEMEVYRHECVACAIRYQNEGYDFVTYLKDTFTFSYAFLILNAVVTLAMNLFRLSTAILVTHDMQEIYSVTILTITEFLYMYYLNYLMQNVGDYAATLSSVVYNHPWYNRSLAFRKNIPLILFGSSRSISFDYYGFYSATLEGFSSVCIRVNQHHEIQEDVPNRIEITISKSNVDDYHRDTTSRV
ncbi:uncharacterized protein LOC143210508 [Lasioglossum baleicum]|uniref:uncharacterized protein LOC143210508 n=1 Tax=Lasioglossum baleicum TaxID=434251 RepID=UPI003FCDABDD